MRCCLFTACFAAANYQKKTINAAFTRPHSFHKLAKHNFETLGD